MQINILTLFPQIFEPFLSSSIIGRAAKKRLVEYKIFNLRDFGEGKHQVVDGRPYGGGAGMILRADILEKAVKKIMLRKGKKSCIILTSASGHTFNQKKAGEYSKLDKILIICGHYEGIDQRFIDKYVDSEISIGDYVLTGGEIPAMVIIDSIVRLIPKVLKKPEAIRDESFQNGTLEYPHYTKPLKFHKESVPDVLVSGNHQEIAKYKLEKSLQKTIKFRPDLIKGI